MSLIDILLMLGAILSALAIGATCVVGLVVWLAGGKPDERKDL